METNIAKFKIRRGKQKHLKDVMFDEGELAYITDTSRLVVGNGITYGGIGLPIIKFVTNLDTSLFDSSGYHTGDLLINTNTTGNSSTLHAVSNDATLIQISDINIYNPAAFSGNKLSVDEPLSIASTEQSAHITFNYNKNHFTVNEGTKQLSINTGAIASQSDVGDVTDRVNVNENNIESLSAQLYNRKILLSLIYNVGDYIFTENPKLSTVTAVNEQYGGKWKKIEGVALVGAMDNPALSTDANGVSFEDVAGTNANQPGEIIGEYKHQLTVNEMPSHRHFIAYPADGGYGANLADNPNITIGANSSGNRGYWAYALAAHNDHLYDEATCGLTSHSGENIPYSNLFRSRTVFMYKKIGI